MSTFLTFSIRLLDGRYHARIDRGRKPEWPPSPMRLFQAIVAGVAPRWHAADVRDRERPALLWLERQPAPLIVTPTVHHAQPLLTYVPNNNDPATNERTAKIIEPTVLHNGDRHIEWRYAMNRRRSRRRPSNYWSDRHIEWRYAMNPSDAEAVGHAGALSRLVRHVSHLGWGIDLAIGDALVGEPAAVSDGRVTHTPSTAPFAGGTALRAPMAGTLDSLEAVHQSKADRFATPGVLTLRNEQPTFAEVTYAASARRNRVAFRFIDENDEDVAYRTTHIKEIAGRLRHLVAESCKGRFEEAFIHGTILGHPKDAPRLSILPIPSIGHRHVDGRVRRVIFVEPLGGDGSLCRHLSRVLDQHQLDFDGNCPCLPSRLVALPRSDSVLQRYSASAKTWASVTPVLLPGHNQRKQDDHSRALARACRLVAKSLQQAGVTTPATFAIDRVPYLAGTRHVREYDPRDKLAHCPRYHVKITFAQPVTGPLAIGAGRHVGFGTLAALRDGE